jgi:hypothetical protein
MQRNFGPLKQQVEEWQALQLSTASAKLLIYRRSSRMILGFRSTWRGACTNSISGLCMRSSRRELCGASRTHSRARSRSWSQYPSTRRLQSWRVSCNGSAFIVPIGNIGVPSRGRAVCLGHCKCGGGAGTACCWATGGHQHKSRW